MQLNKEEPRSVFCTSCALFSYFHLTYKSECAEPEIDNSLCGLNEAHASMHTANETCASNQNAGRTKILSIFDKNCSAGSVR